jgi:hypothetical protein
MVSSLFKSIELKKAIFSLCTSGDKYREFLGQLCKSLSKIQ